MKTKASPTRSRAAKRKPAARTKTRKVERPILFIGDLHGNTPLLDEVLTRFPDHFKIFIGDFLDARGTFSRDAELACLERVLSMIERGEARACFGNHEWSYLEPSMRCSGYDPEFDRLLDSYKERMRKLLEFYIWLPRQRILVTHAGLSAQIWEDFHLTIKNLPAKLREWSMRPLRETPAGWIGIARGGNDDIGGIFWCDWYYEFQPVKGLRQVLGHTSAVSVQEDLTHHPVGIRVRKNSYNIDCLQRTWEVLELGPGGRLKIIKLAGNESLAAAVL